MNQLLSSAAVALARSTLGLVALLCFGAASAAVPGIAGPDFKLTAAAGMISQPDGAMIYMWGYGCDGEPVGGYKPFKPTGFTCPQMQLPGPTLIVKEGDTVTVQLTNRLPPSAGTTSIVFPGQTITAATGGTAGPLVQEAGGSNCSGTGCNVVTYAFTASKPGTYTYYSGSQPAIQQEMGLYGALVVLPSSMPSECKALSTSGSEYRLAAAAYDHAATCYDREYLFQFSEISSDIHDQVKQQVDACGASNACPLNVVLEPYRANYYLVNGRSMPDLMDTAYSPAYPRQPYNGNPHMHPGEIMLMRNVGHGRWQHPFHFHGNHARVIARDGNMLVAATDPAMLAGPLLFTLPTLPGQTVDMLFSWTGQGLNWDVYGEQLGANSTALHTCNNKPPFDPAGKNMFFPVGSPRYSTYDGTSPVFDSVTKEYCADHGKPFPVVPPDPNIVANGQWYGGTPYLGLTNFNGTVLPPGTLNQNPSAGYSYMWHSHNEREITTNDVFPGGILMMLIIDSASYTIDETL